MPDIQYQDPDRHEAPAGLDEAVPPSPGGRLSAKSAEVAARVAAAMGITKKQLLSQMGDMAKRSLFGADSDEAIASSSEHHLKGRLLVLQVVSACIEDIKRHYWGRPCRPEEADVGEAAAKNARSASTPFGLEAKTLAEFLEGKLRPLLIEKLAGRTDLTEAVRRDIWNAAWAEASGFLSRQTLDLDLRDALAPLVPALVLLGSAGELFAMPELLGSLLTKDPSIPSTDLRRGAGEVIQAVLASEEVRELSSPGENGLALARRRLLELVVALEQHVGDVVRFHLAPNPQRARQECYRDAGKTLCESVAPHFLLPGYRSEHARGVLGQQVIMSVLRRAIRAPEISALMASQDLFASQGVLAVSSSEGKTSVRIVPVRVDMTIEWGNERFNFVAGEPVEDSKRRHAQLSAAGIFGEQVQLSPYVVTGTTDAQRREFDAFELPGVPQRAFLHMKTGKGFQPGKRATPVLATGTCLFSTAGVSATLKDGSSVPLTDPSVDLLLATRRNRITDVVVSPEPTFSEVDSVVRLATIARGLMTATGSKISRALVQVPLEEYILYLAEPYLQGAMTPELYGKWIGKVQERNAMITSAFRRLVSRDDPKTYPRVEPYRPLAPLESYLTSTVRAGGRITVEACCEILLSDGAAPWAHLLGKGKHTWPQTFQELSYLSYLCPLLVASTGNQTEAGLGVGLYNTVESQLEQKLSERAGSNSGYVFLSSFDCTMLERASRDEKTPETPYRLPANPPFTDVAEAMGVLYGVERVSEYFRTH